MLNGYQLNGGRGQHRNTQGWRQQRNAGRGGLVPTADGLRQRDLHGNILRNVEDYWGDQIRPKEEHQLRIVFQNINRFPMYASDPKNDSIRAFLKGIQADIVGMAELGICWPKLPTKDRIWE
jgi:formylglycine-generating enzyme required for sulfatase activity